MKKALSLILALVMALSLTVPAFAETDNSTDITLTVAKELTYDMVIPEDVTNLANYGIYEVGKAKVANVKNATDNTVISYTATTTAFKCEGKTDIPASYYTDEAGQNDFPTTAVEVYENKEDAENIPTMYVGISETDWNAAENGTYTATVTYNFSAKKVTAADALVIGAQFRVTGKYDGEHVVVGTYKRSIGSEYGFERVSLTEDIEDISETKKGYCALLDGDIYFADSETKGNENFEIWIYPYSDQYYTLEGSFISFEVMPAGETEFTEVELTLADLD